MNIRLKLATAMYRGGWIALLLMLTTVLINLAGMAVLLGSFGTQSSVLLTIVWAIGFPFCVSWFLTPPRL